MTFSLFLDPLLRGQKLCVLEGTVNHFSISHSVLREETHCLSYCLCSYSYLSYYHYQISTQPNYCSYCLLIYSLALKNLYISLVTSYQRIHLSINCTFIVSTRIQRVHLAGLVIKFTKNCVLGTRHSKCDGSLHTLLFKTLR